MRSLSVLRNSLLNFSRRRSENIAAICSPISALRRHQRYRSSSSSLAVPKFPILMFTEHEYEIIIRMKLIKFRTFSPITNEIMYPFSSVPEEISKSFCAGSSRGWLLFVSRVDCRMYLTDLLSSPSSPTYVSLPPIDTLPHVNRVPCCCSNLMLFEMNDRINDEVHCFIPAVMGEMTIYKVAITSDPTHDTDCIVMISCGPACELAYCRIGDTSWTFLERQPGRGEFMDVVYCQKDKLFYAVATGSHIEAFDLITNPSSPRRFDCSFTSFDERASEYAYKIFEKSFRVRSYLVESPQGDMLLVTRYFVNVARDGSILDVDDDGDEDEDRCLKHPYRSVYFQVFKLDFKNQTGRRVDDLEDTALFLGLNESFSLSVRDYPQLSSNSIYFADDLINLIYNRAIFTFGGHDFGVYDLNEETVSPLYGPFQIIRDKPPAFWVSGA